ncbi:zinc finger protein 160-like [Cydia pomonella]|uniref:zinc finger protein 160-like n=1 Tax=Cydia pomonella TaxID=82600 RepID=UPI002ADE7F68|nr:zinc finger protein 160-like [Cydia pomonella]
MTTEAEKNCFVCSKTGGNLNIFTTYNICNDKEELYVEVIKNCFSIEIGRDSGLYAMCTGCSIKLRRAYTFKNDIIQAVNKLVVLQDAVAEETEYSKLEYFEHTFENDYDIKSVLNPETGQISYTLDKINENKETNELDTYMIDLENDVIITKEEAEQKVKKTQRKNEVVKENLPNNIESKVKPRKTKKKKTVEINHENSDKVENNIKDDVGKACKKIITIEGNLVNAPSTDQEEKNKKPKKVKNAKKPKFTLEPGQTQCSLCTTQFETNKALRVHMNAHFPDHVCGDCGMAFASQQRLRSHVYQTHNAEESQACKYCDKIFTNVNTRNAHMWRVHTKTDPYKCAQCGERFKTYLKRLRHMQAAHGDSVTEYPCQYCDKKFAYAAYRTKHVRTVHLEARPHKCADCPFSFARRRELAAHRASKHGDGELKYQCHVCDKKFFFNTALKFHVNLHNRHTCTQCDAKFTSNENLEAHLKTHDPHEPLDTSLDGLPILDSLEFNELADYALDSAFWVLGNEL